MHFASVGWQICCNAFGFYRLEMTDLLLCIWVLRCFAASKPASQPASQPAQPASKPVSQPASKPAGKRASQQSRPIL